MDHRIVCRLLSTTRLGIEGAGIEREADIAVRRREAEAICWDLEMARK
jgi:hypothetical protein